MKFLKLINKFIKKIKYKKNIDLIGLSGQTIFHDPKNQLFTSIKFWKRFI